jgi:mono/diheme cytochrome c family protein
MGNSANHISGFPKNPPRKVFALRNMKAICLTCAALFLFMLPLVAQDTAASLYKTKCALCHAPDGSGSGPVGKQLNVPNLRLRQAQTQTADQWIQITEDGKGKMPAYKGRLSDDQIRQLVTYTRELAKTK